MCKECGCSNNAIGGTPEKLTGKPTKDKYGKAACRHATQHFDVPELPGPALMRSLPALCSGTP